MTAPVTTSLAPAAKALAGTLAKTPMPRLLVSASSARVTGTLELACKESGETATLSLVRGFVTKVKTSVPVAYLGSILYELGFIDDAELNESLRELARTKWLHGEILLTRAAITLPQLAEGLHEQTARKLVHLFSLPVTTTYSFESDVDRLATWGGTDWPHVDPFAAVWRAVRDGFADDDVAAAMEKVKDSSFRVIAGASTKRFELSEVEGNAVECLRARPFTLDELVETASIDAKRARSLLYFLCVTKLAEAIDASGTRPAYRPPSASMPVRASMPVSASMPVHASVPPSAHTRPTLPEMSAVQTRASMRPETSESARWRAMSPATPGSSMKVPVAPMSSGASSATRITMGGIAPSEAPRTSNRPSPMPAARVSSPVPAHIPSPVPRSVPERASSSMRAAPPVDPSSGSWKTASASMPVGRLSELDARKVSIHERARAILREDFFQRLSLPRDASYDQVDAAYEALRTLWDPGLLPPALEDARDDCSFVMSCLGEAHATLREPRAREEYVSRLGTTALRALADQYGEDLAASGAANALEGAYACFAKSDLERAERLARRAHKQQTDSAKALGLLAWLEAQKSSNSSGDALKQRVAMLDKAVRLDEGFEQGFWWRAQLHKRLENHQLAMRDFRRVVELNPKNVDAQRELRVYEMRIRNNSITMKAVR